MKMGIHETFQMDVIESKSTKTGVRFIPNPYISFPEEGKTVLILAGQNGLIGQVP